MAEVTISVGGRPFVVGCRDGEEDRLRALGMMITDRWPAAQRAAGGTGMERALLFVALMLSDELDDALVRPAEGAAVSETALARIADRLESLAATLEHVAPST